MPPLGRLVPKHTKFRIVKAALSFANTAGGFIVFGVDACGNWIGFSEAEMQHYQQLADNLQEALEQQDVSRICEIATESTLKWQKVNEKRELERVTSLVHETGAMGIANAHSGTYLGILYDKNRHDQGAIMDRVGRAFPHYSMRWFMTTSCGTAKERTR